MGNAPCNLDNTQSSRAEYYNAKESNSKTLKRLVCASRPAAFWKQVPCWRCTGIVLLLKGIRETLFDHAFQTLSE